MEISRKTLFESETLQISLFEARDVTDACGDVERQSQNAIALPPQIVELIAARIHARMQPASQ